MEETKPLAISTPKVKKESSSEETETTTEESEESSIEVPKAPVRQPATFGLLVKSSSESSLEIPTKRTPARCSLSELNMTEAHQVPAA